MSDNPQGIDNAFRVNMSRRTFLKRVRDVAIGGLIIQAVGGDSALPPQPALEIPPAEPTEDNQTPEAMQSEKRFFESIETFNPEETIPYLEEKFTKFTEQFAPDIQRYLGTSSGVLPETFSNSLKVLKGAHEAYLALRQSNNPIHNSYITEVSNVFYEIGSGLHAIDQVYETYREQPVIFGQILQNYADGQFRSDAYTDLLVGDDILTYKATWADPAALAGSGYIQLEGDKPQYISPVIELLAARRLASGEFDTWINSPYYEQGTCIPGLARLVHEGPLDRFPPETGTEHIPNARLEPVSPRQQTEQGIQTTQRQAEVLIESKDTEAKKYITELLKQHALERVIPEIIITELGQSGAGAFVKHRPPYRFMEFDQDFLATEYRKQFPIAAESITLHEFGHAFDFAMSYLPPSESQKLRAEVENLLTKVRPYQSLKTLYAPVDIAPHTEVDVTAEHGLERRKNEQDKTINWTTLTDYATREYTQSNHGVVPLNEASRSTGIMMETDKFFQVVSDYLPHQGITLHLAQEQLGKIYPTFQDFFIDISRNAITADTLGELLTAAIAKNINILNNATREGYAFENNSGDFWAAHLKYKVAPTVLAQLIKTQPENVQTALSTSRDNLSHQDQEKITHAVEVYRKKIKLIEQTADSELWSDIFSATLRRNNPEVHVSSNISEDLWNGLDTLIDKIKTRLTQHGLALHDKHAALTV